MKHPGTGSINPMKLALRIFLCALLCAGLVTVLHTVYQGFLIKQTPGGSPVGVMIPVFMMFGTIFVFPTFLVGLLLEKRAASPIERFLSKCGILCPLIFIAGFCLGVLIHGLQ